MYITTMINNHCHLCTNTWMVTLYRALHCIVHSHCYIMYITYGKQPLSLISVQHLYGRHCNQCHCKVNNLLQIKYMCGKQPLAIIYYNCMVTHYQCKCHWMYTNVKFYNHCYCMYINQNYGKQPIMYVQRFI